MNRLGDVWRSTRLPLIISAAPFALVWAAIPGGPGALVAPAYLALLLFALMTQDAASLERGVQPRLNILHGTGRHDLSLVRTTRAAAGIAVLVIALLALFMLKFALALTLVLAFVVILVLAVIPYRAAPLRFIEVFWPLAIMMLPLVLISAITDDPMPRSSVAATTLGALLISAAVLICLLRDRALDRTDRLSSTVTELGSGTGQLFLFLALAVASVFAIWGASAGWWHWSASATSVLASLAAIWAVAAGQFSSAGPIWWIGHSITAIIIAVTAIAAN